jgi:bacillithiol synthase
VAGPGEIAYYGQLNVLYASFGMEPPVIHPRFAATLVDERVDRDLARLGWSLDDLGRPEHELEERLARAAVPPGVAESLTEAGDRMAEGYRGLIDAAGEIDPTLRGALGRLRNESLYRLGVAERKILRAVKRREAESIARMRRVRAAVFPFDASQERVMNVLGFLAEQPALLDELHGAIGSPFARTGPRVGSTGPTSG